MILSSSYNETCYLNSFDRDRQLSLHNQSVLSGCGSTETHNAVWRREIKEGGGKEAERGRIKMGRRKGG